MTISIKKEDIINLVKSVNPTKTFSESLPVNSGVYTRGYGWKWNSETLEGMEEKELFTLYRSCLKSWK